MTTSMAPEEARFVGLATQWERETSLLSNADAIVNHVAYREIINMGEPALRYILEELADLGQEPRHWFYALVIMAGDDAAEGSRSMEQARQAWVRWGRDQGYLPRQVNTSGSDF